jgi:hypothetical protein
MKFLLTDLSKDLWTPDRHVSSCVLTDLLTNELLVRTQRIRQAEKERRTDRRVRFAFRSAPYPTAQDVWPSSGQNLQHSTTTRGERIRRNAKALMNPWRLQV